MPQQNVASSSPSRPRFRTLPGKLRCARYRASCEPACAALISYLDQPGRYSFPFFVQIHVGCAPSFAYTYEHASINQCYVVYTFEARARVSGMFKGDLRHSFELTVRSANLEVPRPIETAAEAPITRCCCCGTIGIVDMAIKLDKHVIVAGDQLCVTVAYRNHSLINLWRIEVFVRCKVWLAVHSNSPRKRYTFKKTFSVAKAEQTITTQDSVVHFNIPIPTDSLPSHQSDNVRITYDVKVRGRHNKWFAGKPAAYQPLRVFMANVAQQQPGVQFYQQVPPEWQASVAPPLELPPPAYTPAALPYPVGSAAVADPAPSAPPYEFKH
eukprot:m.187842 g.187842  ORF g.187842 m.187842 type:complete len:326 (-) comp10553_c0_seq4:102-1079(-)